MIKKAYILSLVLLLIGCGKFTQEPKTVEIGEIPDDCFVGTLECRQKDSDKGKQTIFVKHWLSNDKIRREVRSEDHEGNMSQNYYDGVIINLKDQSAVVYRSSGEDKRFFIKMSLYEFDNMGPIEEIETKGVGDIYYSMPHQYNSENTANEVEIEGYRCDKLLISFKRAATVEIETHHAPEIKFNRDLLCRVERDLPKEVVGFPLYIKKTSVAPKYSKVKKETSEWKKMLKSIANDISTILDGIKEAKVHKVVKAKIEELSFEIPEGFVEVSDMDSFISKFRPQIEGSGGGGGFDFDDWD